MEDDACSGRYLVTYVLVSAELGFRIIVTQCGIHITTNLSWASAAHGKRAGIGRFTPCSRRWPSIYLNIDSGLGVVRQVKADFSISKVAVIETPHFESR